MVSSPKPMRFFILLPTAKRITSVPTNGTGSKIFPPPAAPKQSSAIEHRRMADRISITPPRLSCTVVTRSLQVRSHRADSPEFNDVKSFTLSLFSNNSRALSGMASVNSSGISAAYTGTMLKSNTNRIHSFRITASPAAAPTPPLTAGWTQ